MALDLSPAGHRKLLLVLAAGSVVLAVRAALAGFWPGVAFFTICAVVNYRLRNRPPPTFPPKNPKPPQFKI